jgi:hypothetical protein
MLSPAQIAEIKTEIEKLETALHACTNSGLRMMIESRLKTLKQELASGEESSQPKS